MDAYWIILRVIFLAAPALGFASALWLLQIGFFSRDERISPFHLGIAGIGMLFLLAWIFLVPGSVPGVIDPVGIWIEPRRILTTTALCAFQIVALWRPLFHGIPRERMAALLGFPCPLFLVAYILLRLLA